MNVMSHAAAQAHALAARLRAVAADLGSAVAVEFRGSDAPRRPYPTLRPRKRAPGPQPTNVQVALALQARGRDLFGVTDALRTAVVAELRQRFPGATLPNRGALLMATAYIYKRWVVARALDDGADLALPGNAARYTDYKRRLGLSALRARASGQLAAWLDAARPVLATRR